MSEFSNILKSVILAEERGMTPTQQERRKLLRIIKSIEDESKRIVLLHSVLSAGFMSAEEAKILFGPKNIESDISIKLYYGESLNQPEISFLKKSDTTTLMNIIMSHYDLNQKALPLVVLRVMEITNKPILLILVTEEMQSRGLLREFILDFKDMEKFYHSKYFLSPIDSFEGEPYELAIDMCNREVFCWSLESMLKVEEFLVNYGLAKAYDIISNTPPNLIKDSLRSLDPIWILCYLIDINIAKHFSDSELIAMKNLLRYSPYFVVFLFQSLLGSWTPGKERRKIKLMLEEAFNEGLEIEYDVDEMTELGYSIFDAVLYYYILGDRKYSE